MREFQVIQHLLPDLQTQSSDPPADYVAQQKVFQVLKNLLGQSAQFLLPTLFQSGRLLLISKTSVWATHIKNRQQSIIDQGAELGLIITEIIVKIQPENPADTRQSLPPSLSKAKHGLSSASLKSIEKIRDETSNPRLKQAFERLQQRVKKSVIEP